MYKFYLKNFVRPPRCAANIILTMKLTTLLLIISILQVSASSFAQKLSLQEKNASLSTVLKEIRKQSGFDFVVTTATLNASKPVNINVKNQDIGEVLTSIFNDQPLEYKIEDKLVVVSMKEKGFLDKVISVFKAIDVYGKVVDETGYPAPGVTVTVKGTNNQTSTDKDGLFTLKAVQPNDILVFSSIGMDTVEVPVNNRTTVTVSMKAKVNNLKEVTINTGYQIIKQEQSTGATVTVGSAELEKRYTPNIIDRLEGQVPGLVNYRGTTTIRGVGTINANQSVLYVVDGLPIEGSIANINPYDVESITVLKDAASAAIYGIRAANGVIVVVTKKAKNNRTTVEVDGNVTITQKPNIDYNLLTPSQQVDFESSYYKYYYANTGGAYGSTAAAVTKTGSDINAGNSITPVQYAYYQLAQGQITQSQLDAQLAGFRLNDFRKQFKDNALRNDVLQQYNLAVRSGSAKFQSNLIVNFKNDNSGIINAYNKQLNIFYKGGYQVSKWLDVNYGVNGVLSYIKASNSNFATSATNVSPYLQLLDANGNRVYYTTSDYNMYNTNTATQPLYSQLVNHLDELGKDMADTKQTNTRYFVNLNAKIIDGLTFTPQFQYENNLTAVSAYSESDSYIMRYLKSVYTTMLPANGGKLATTNTTADYWTARAQADYKKSFGKNAIDVIAGTEFRQSRTKGVGGLLLGYDDQLQSQSTTSVNFPALFAYNASTGFKLGYNPLGLYNTYIAGPIAVIPETVHRTNSNYANATYTYDNKYNAFGSYRIDYADVFGLDEKFRGKPLWSSGVSWNIHNESFMSDVNWVSFLKFRATYGITGNINQGVSSFLTANSSLINAVTNLPSSVVTNAANPDLRWEKTTTTNLGIDFALFKNRLNGSFDWYRKKGTDLLVTQRIDASEGFTSQIINNGSLLNNGLELSLQYSWFKPGRADGLGWSTTLVLSQNNNKIIYVDQVAATPILLAQGGYKVGYPVNSLFSFQYKGLTSTGQPQWLKADGTLTTTGLTSSDLNAVVFSGGKDPKITTALTNEVRYKGFSLYVLAVYYGGQYLRSQYPDPYTGFPYGSMPSYILNSWTPSNPNTLNPGFGQYAPGVYPGTSPIPANHLAYSDAFVIHGDFIKIRTMSLGYQLPRLMAAKLGSSGVKLSFQLNNPKALWLKNKINVDPETGGAAIPTSYVFGANFNF